MADPLYENQGSCIVKLQEECAELIHILCKIQRFGLNNFNPYDPQKRSNYELLILEIKDVEKKIKEIKQSLGID